MAVRPAGKLHFIETIHPHIFSKAAKRRVTIVTPLPAPVAGLPAQCTYEHTTTDTTIKTNTSFTDVKAEEDLKPDKYPQGMTKSLEMAFRQINKSNSIMPGMKISPAKFDRFLKKMHEFLSRQSLDYS